MRSIIHESGRPLAGLFPLRTVHLLIPLCLAVGGSPMGASSGATLRSIVAPETAPYPIHLGAQTREWSYFEGRTPHGAELRLKFNSTPNTREYTLFIRQDDVKQDWTVTLNGRKLGSLFLFESDLVHTLPIPANLLRDGENELHIATQSTTDDIVIHSLAIGEESKEKLLDAGPLTVTVTSSGAAIPARITIVDTHGSLAAVHDFASTNLATRPGVIYTGTGSARLALLPGEYTVYATRGPEYSLAESRVMLGASPKSLNLNVKREVDTSDWIASDTHIHTFSLSKHGDALLHERAITIAAEAIDLPIATEHNLHADYSGAAKELGLARYYTAVPGNEVTTRQGHFNIFPVSLDAPPPDHNILHWPDLLKKIRQSPAVKIAILNHPTDTHVGFTPYAVTNLNPVTGKNLRGDFEFTFDGMELINSGAMRTDWMEPFRAWFALLNRGRRIVGVGASDSHDVSRFIVGQGRTYIRGNDSDPGCIDVAAACEALKAGRAVVSLGLFPRFTIFDTPSDRSARDSTRHLAPRSEIGDLHRARSEYMEIHGTIEFPAWMAAPRADAMLYANGRPAFGFSFGNPGALESPLTCSRRFPKPKTDTWYVLVAHTAGVTNAYWSIARPYQPSSPEWHPAMIGATNPIYVDADGDGRFTPPREVAARLASSSEKPLLEALADYDWATAVHAAEILHEGGADLQDDNFRQSLAKAPQHVREAFADYLKTISKQ